MSRENAKCLLCGRIVERMVFRDPLGWKYNCLEYCGLYAVGGEAHSYIEVFVKDQDMRMKLADYVKAHPAEDKYKELGLPEIGKVLGIHVPSK